MNPGYLSLVLFCIALILLASGWAKILFSGLSERLLFGLAIAWLALTFVELKLGQWDIDLALGFYGAITSAGLIALRREWLHLLAMGLLLGGISFLSGELTRLNPALTVHSPVHAGTLLLIATAVLLQRPCLAQIVMLNTALLSGHLLSAAASKVPPVIAGPAFQDEWWQTILFARIATVSVEAAWRNGRRLLGYFRQKRKDDWN